MEVSGFSNFLRHFCNTLFAVVWCTLKPNMLSVYVLSCVLVVVFSTAPDMKGYVLLQNRGMPRSIRWHFGVYRNAFVKPSTAARHGFKCNLLPTQSVLFGGMVKKKYNDLCMFSLSFFCIWLLQFCVCTIMLHSYLYAPCNRLLSLHN